MKKDKCPIPPWGTPELLEEICRRSAKGEGVRQVIAEKGLSEGEALLWLRDHHEARIKAAKQEQKKLKGKDE